MTQQLGMMMAGGKATSRATPLRPREKNDFYPTPPEVMAALLRAEADSMPQMIWEPAAGKGDLVRAIEATGRTVAPSDLHDYGQNFPIQNFFEVTTAPAPAMVTNSPFNVAAEWIAHALDLNIPYIALLLKATYWHAKKRTALWNRRPPSRVYALTWRVDFLNLGSPVMEVIWCVWTPENTPTQYILLHRGDQSASLFPETPDEPQQARAAGRCGSAETIPPARPSVLQPGLRRMGKLWFQPAQLQPPELVVQRP